MQEYWSMEQGLPFIKLGILGGGQLGRMTAMAARSMGFEILVLDPTHRPPSFGLAHDVFVGSLYDEEAIRDFAKKCAVISYEIEHINVEVLLQLEKEGIVFYPSPRVLSIIQDKLVQKTFLKNAGVPIPDFYETLPPHASYPIVQKLRKGGYDGRGVTILKSDADEVFTEPSMFETCIDIDKELAIMIARNPSGETASYPVVEMVFDPRAQICSSVLAPARISAQVAQMCEEIAQNIVRELDFVGILAVELFLTKGGEVLVNELAPRAHNSGHWTIEGCVTSQFQQHLRAILDLPLGDTSIIRPSLMINLLGEPGAEGRPIIRGYKEAMTIPGLNMHWYEKTSVKENRKMGHITICGKTVEEALLRGELAQSLLRIEGDA